MRIFAGETKPSGITLTTDLPDPPILCLLAPRSDSSRPPRAIVGGPPQASVFRAAVGVSAVAALRACAQAHPGRDIVLLAPETRLPESWWPRLCAARDLPFDVLSPLSDATAILDPFDPRDRPDAVDDADACVWMLADAEPIPCRSWLPACCLWRANAIPGLPADLADGELAPGQQAAALDTLYVLIGAAEPLSHTAAPAPAAIAVLRRRIAGLQGRIPVAVGRDATPVMLHVLHGWGGGVQHFVENLMTSSHGYRHLALLAHGSSERRQPGEALALHDDLRAEPIASWPLALGIVSTALASNEYQAALARILKRFRVGCVLVSSLIGHGLAALHTGLPTAVVCHDYYPLWPRLHEDFGDASRDFSASALDAALQDPGPGFSFAETRATAWRRLREDYVNALLAAPATFFYPSRSVRRNIERIEPRLAHLRWQFIPHGMAPWPFPVTALDPPPREGLRVLVLGRISGGKGEDLLTGLVPLLDPRIELVLLGSGRAGMHFFGTSMVHVRLDYDHAELPALIHQIAPDLALIPVTVAETFSYTLSELRSLGVPVLATRIGSLAERIRDGNDGLLADPDAASVAARLRALLDDRSVLGPLRTPTPQASLQSMARAYEAALELPPASPWPALKVGDPVQSASLHVLALQAHRLADEINVAHALTRRQQLELDRRGEWGDQLQTELSERTAWVGSLETDLTDARQHLQRLSEEMDERTAWVAALEADLATARQHIRRRDEELKERATWAKSLETDLATARQHVQRVSGELEERTAWVAAIETDLATAHQHVQRLSGELEARTTWAKSLEADLTTARQHIQRQDQELEERAAWALSLQGEIDMIREELASLWLKLEEKQTELVEANSQVTQGEQEIAQLRNWLHTAVTHGETMQADRDAILASRSWRLTRPLRYAFRLVDSVLARLKFRWHRLISTLRRTRVSLRHRGLNGTAARIRDELRPTVPTKLASMPVPATSAAADLVLPGSDAPVASIVIPVYNHLDTTLVCLRALAETRNRTPHEIIIVDDCSSDASATTLPSVQGLRYLRNQENLGFIGACNAGAAQACGEFVVFLNNDTAVQDGWLDALVDTFEQHRDVGLVGAKLVYPDGRLQEAGGIVFADGSGWNYGRFDDPADPRYNFVREVDYCSGAAIAIRTELFRQFGGFDTHYAPAYYEDTDLAMKVRQAGLRVLYQPASVVVHFEGISSGTDTSSGTKRYQVVNQEKFLARWKDALAHHAAAGSDIAIARQHRARKHVLVIDATTPQPDHDSGSVRLCNILRLLLEEGCAVTFFADNRAFVEGYTQALQQLGVEVLWHPFLSDPVAWFEKNGKRFDLVFVSRHYIASSYVDLVRKHARRARLAFDTVDLHYLREQRAAKLAGSADMARAAEKTRTQELALIHSSDVTLVVSPVEKELLAREAPGAQVEILSNVHEVFGRRRDFAERHGIWFVGGYQHPPNVDAALWFAREMLPLVRTELPEVVLHLVGSRAPAEVKALGEIPGIEFHGFVTDIEPFLDGCRLAVAPLRYGAGVKGKVNMSMSYGQPVVATPIATEGMFAEPGRDVLVAESPADFASAVVRAYRDEALWMQLSDNGLANVARYFSFESARSALRQLLDNSAGKPARN